MDSTVVTARQTSMLFFSFNFQYFLANELSIERFKPDLSISGLKMRKTLAELVRPEKLGVGSLSQSGSSHLMRR